MAEYNLMAILQARDNGFTSTIRRAQKDLERMERGIGDVKKDSRLKIEAGVEGLPKIERLKGALDAARSASRQIDIRARDNTSATLGKIRSNLNALTSKVHTVAVNIKTNGADKLNSLKSQIGDGVSGAAMGMGATMLGTAGIGYGAVSAIQSQMAFEKQMSTVKAIMSGSYSGAALEERIAAITEKAEEMGATTKFTATEAGQALYYMAMAGWKSEQMISGLPSVMNLAAAGNVDLSTTSDILTDSMTGFGLKAGKTVKSAKGEMVEASQYYADLMGAIITHSNTDIPQLGEALKYESSVFGALFTNASDDAKMRAAEDAMLMNALEANAGIKGSQAGTTNRAMMTRLASQNRNAYMATEQALGVKFADEQTGETRRIRDIISDLRSRFKEGIDVEQLLDFEEFLTENKIHADTRRKLEGLLKTAQDNGGKLTGPEMAKLGAMISGQEGMSGLLAVLTAADEDWENLVSAIENASGTNKRIAEMQLDNLAGDFTMLGSAWDAFQRSLAKSPSNGLRDFVQGITDVVSRANAAFKDGIDLGDFGDMFLNVIAKLKNKFLELDGVGSVLAGGVLIMGLKKIATMALSVKDTLSDWAKVRSTADLGERLRSNSSVQQAATMTIKANVVNLSGNFNREFSQQRGQVQNQNRVEDYYRRRAQIEGSARTSRLPAIGKLAGGAGIGAAIFGALDVYAAKSESRYRTAAAQDEVAALKEQYSTLQAQGADKTQLAGLMGEIQQAQMNVQSVAAENAANEQKAIFGAGGAVAGTMAGAAIGSVIPVVGTAVGGLIGGVLGQVLGDRAADIYSAKSTRKNEVSLSDFRRIEENPAAQVQSESITDKYQKQYDFTSLQSSNSNFQTAPPVIVPQINTDNFSLDTFKSSVFSTFDEIAISISTKIGEIGNYLTSFSSIFSTLSGSFEGVGMAVSGVFTGIGAAVSAGVENARLHISSGFSSAASEVQNIWAAIPGFFGGVFGGLGAIAAGAGSMIASGINSGIGMIQSAWESLSGWLSAKVSSIASAAASAAASIGISIGGNASGTAYFPGGFTNVNEHGGELIILPNGRAITPFQTAQSLLREQNIFHNANGTSFFEGGWSEVNEHGGELMYLPKGTRIVPHATTVRILREEIKERLRNNYAEIASLDTELSQQSLAPLDVQSLPPLPNSIPSNVSSNTTNNAGNTINFGGVNISNGMDFDSFMYRLSTLIGQGAENYGG